ncbi:MAG: GerMN domain-containing protein [Armatimonadota bacterium]|nr:GerMN domain-containing protein [Armatimonadota bacterium]MDR7518467.1 GerMN domain-containing protein [Armatimonadota bacterium]MDR7550561.1 GerMN domain-containing protein [Armatimonadota bacterium]
MRRTLLWLAVVGLAAVLVWWTQVRPQPVAVRIYFVTSADGAATVAPVERTVVGRRTPEILRAALEALLAGPSAAERARGLVTEIPAGTRLRGVTVQDGVAVIDLTEAVASGGGSSSMLGRLWQIVYTGTDVPGIAQVRILIEGAERPGLGGEGVLIDRPLSRPAVFPRF